jgi:hypothetical protein
MAEPATIKRQAGKKLGIVAAIMTLVAMVFWVDSLDGNILGFRFWKWHQKLTITITTPSGTKSAYAVTKVFWDMPPRWFRLGDSGGWHGAGSLEGEALVLEVDHGKYLFALLDDYPAGLAIQLFAEPPLKSGHPDEFARVLNRIGTVRETRSLKPAQYPTLVTFNDNNDPASVRRIDPARLDASFGPGYLLDSITMTIVEEPLTMGRVNQVLEWLDWPHDRFLALGNGRNPIRFSDGEQTTSLGRQNFRRD